MAFRSTVSLPATRDVVLSVVALLAPLLLLLAPAIVLGQPYGATDATAPGDAMIDRWLAARTARIERTIGDDLLPSDATRQERLRAEYLSMLGLDPLPARTPLGTTVTGSLEGDGLSLIHI